MSKQINEYEIYLETELICNDLFTKLQKHKSNFSKLQKLEAELSTNIHSCEVQIINSKTNDPTIEQEYRRRRCILKRIADGLAWSVFGFDSDFMFESSRHPSPGFMGNKIGYENERQVLNSSLSIEQIKFILQNDITNCIRNKGDLTILFEDNKIIPLEIKSSESGQREHIRKQKKLQAKFEKENIQNVYVPLSSDDYNWNKIELLYNKSKLKGFAYDVSDDVVFALYHKYPFPLSEIALAKMFKHPFFLKSHPKVFELSDSFKYNENSELNYILPPTAFNIKSDVISNIFNGTHNIKIILDLRKLKQKIEENVKCNVMFDQDNNIHCELDGGLKLQMSHRTLLPIIYSFQKSDYLIKTIKETSSNSDQLIREFEKKTE
jgi:hypothetical protein